MRDRAPTRSRDAEDLDGAYHTRLDEPGTEVVPSLLGVIAAVEGDSPTDLPPLYETLDPDGLETLLDASRDPLSITFRYLDYRVTVSNDGAVSLTAVGNL